MSSNNEKGGIREYYMQYSPSMVEAMTVNDINLLHRLRRMYHDDLCISEAELGYMCVMTRCVNDKLLTFNCLCPDCFIVWDIVSDEMLEWMKYNGM